MLISRANVKGKKEFIISQQPRVIQCSQISQISQFNQFNRFKGPMHEATWARHLGSPGGAQVPGVAYLIFMSRLLLHR